MNLKIEYLKKEDLKPYANNAKIHTAEQVEQIKKSIREFGFNDPVAIWHDNEIIEGHGRLLAAMEMDDVKDIPVIRLDDLTDEQRRAYMLVHNKLTMNTDFNEDVLVQELESLVDENLGFYGFDIDNFIKEDMEESYIEDEISKYEEGEIKFSDYVDEVSQYVVLKFNNLADWKHANELFELKKVKTWPTRKDGKENGVVQKGLGRVLDGMKAIQMVIDNYKMLEG